jgi:cyclopropane fatty-acyl-phospholipid synthase-like methyltransferase
MATQLTSVPRQRPPGVRDDLRRLAHAGLTFNAPLSDERATALLGALPIAPGHHVLDLGCGWGELLLRVVDAHPATTGTGVDTDRGSLDRGRRLAAQRGLLERVDFVEAQAASFAERGDVVLCVGSSHAFGGSEAALLRLADRAQPGGRILYGDAFWAQAPGPMARRVIGELPSFDDLAAFAHMAGLRVEHADRSSLAEWDAFEAGWRSGLEASSDPDTVALAAERKREYEDGYRGALGFAWLVLASS